jgi:hypothetical protein
MINRMPLCPRRPTTDDRRPTTDDRRPTTDDRRPTKALSRKRTSAVHAGQVLANQEP